MSALAARWSSCAAEARENARIAVEQDPVCIATESDERTYWRRVWLVLAVSPTIAIGEALLRGESVPLSQLDPEWIERLGWQP